MEQRWFNSAPGTKIMPLRTGQSKVPEKMPNFKITISSPNGILMYCDGAQRPGYISLCQSVYKYISRYSLPKELS